MPQLGFDFVPPATAQEQQYRAARDLPDGEAALIKAARSALVDYDRARRKANEDTVAAAALRYRTIAIKLNGGSPSGMSTEWKDDDAGEGDGAAVRLEKALAAPDGKVPMWGQRGRFILEFPEVRAIVAVRGVLVGSFHDLELTALDYDRPFLSETGYLSLHGATHEEDRAETLSLMVKRQVKEFREDWQWSRGKRRRVVRPLPPLKQTRNEWDDDTGERVEIPIAPPTDDPAWQEGGWIFAYLKANPPPQLQRQAPRRGRR